MFCQAPDIALVERRREVPKTLNVKARINMAFNSPEVEILVSRLNFLEMCMDLFAQVQTRLVHPHHGGEVY